MFEMIMRHLKMCYIALFNDNAEDLLVNSVKAK